jgi:hypothetical protein
MRSSNTLKATPASSGASGLRAAVSAAYQTRKAHEMEKATAWIATSTDTKKLKDVRKRAEGKTVVVDAIDKRFAQLRQPQERTVHINALKALGVGPFPINGEALSEAAFYRKVANHWGWSATRIAHEITGKLDGVLHLAWHNRILNALSIAYLDGEVMPLTVGTIEWAERELRPLTLEERQQRWGEARDRAPVQYE